MYYSVKFERESTCYFTFEDSKCIPTDSYEYEPAKIFGTITNFDEKTIGTLDIYEFENDFDFFNKCDALSDDCFTIAENICSKQGNILKKYLPKNLEYNTIFILDKISIDSEYRGKGIGTNVIKHLLQMLNYQLGYGCAIFLCASEYESAEKYGFDSKEYSDGCKRLKNFYENAGYSKIKNNIYVYKGNDIL